MTDNELLEKRLEILEQVNRISSFCLCDNTNTKQSCEHCEKMKSLGDQLLKLIKPRKIIKADGSVTEGVMIERRKRSKPKEFTIEEYLLARIKGLTDTQFASTVSMGSRTFVRWKSNNLKEINRLKKKLKVK